MIGEKMSKRKHKITTSFIIGLFVLIGSSVLVGSIFWLGANEFFKTRNFYLSYFEGSIQGLENGSAVKYLGIPVGNVNDISISPDGRLVELKIQIDPDMKITPDMRIKLEYSGLAGGKFLQIFIPDSSTYLAKVKYSFIPKYPVIPSAPSGFDEIASTTKEVLDEMMKIEFGKISTEMVELLASMNAVFQDKNLSLTMSNLQTASKNLSTLFNQLDTTQVIGNFIGTSYDIANSAEELVQTVTTLKTKIQTIEVAGFLDKVYGNYDSTMNQMNGMIRKLSSRSDLMLISLNSLIEDIRKSNHELKNTIQGISDDPSNIFLVHPPKKER
jgi:phospholipid/cholesterol/gamma-HCH transport system substrate-binding protein